MSTHREPAPADDVSAAGLPREIRRSGGRSSEVLVEEVDSNFWRMRPIGPMEKVERPDVCSCAMTIQRVDLAARTTMSIFILV